MMPTHITTEGRRHKKASLARDALRRIPVQIDGDQIVAIACRNMSHLYDHKRNIELCRLQDGSIDISRVRSSKERNAFAIWLRRKGMRLLRENVYSMPTSVDVEPSQVN